MSNTVPLNSVLPIGTYTDGLSMIQDLMEQAGRAFIGAGYGPKLFKFLEDLPQTIDDARHIKWSISGDRNTLYLQVKGSEGKNNLTNRPLDPTWKSYPFTREQVQAL